MSTGGGDTGDDRQDPGKCGGSQEETQCHSLSSTDWWKWVIFPLYSSYYEFKLKIFTLFTSVLDIIFLSL